MSRFSQSIDDDGDETGVDISPLIDCVFILLIFFIVTTVFVEETGVEVDRPQAASASQLEKTSILIAVTKEGQVVYGGKDIGISGVRPLVKRMQQGPDKVPVILQADKDSESGLLIRVLDECKLAGDDVKVSVSTVAGTN